MDILNFVSLVSPVSLVSLCPVLHASFLPLHLNIAKKWASFGRTKDELRDLGIERFRNEIYWISSTRC